MAGRSLLIALICSLALPLAGCAGAREKADAASVLLAFKRDAGYKNAELDRETRNFQKAKEALFEHKGRLAPMGKSSARSFFGDPVAVFRKGDSVVWGYKPASSDWFRGEKIFVTFDGKGNLLSAEYLPG